MMIDELKSRDMSNGVKYLYYSPQHISIGAVLHVCAFKP